VEEARLHEHLQRHHYLGLRVVGDYAQLPIMRN
jgi:hypothetical protein